jgi:hypothetical protein
LKNANLANLISGFSRSCNQLRDAAFHESIAALSDLAAQKHRHVRDGTGGVSISKEENAGNEDNKSPLSHRQTTGL